jgi:hypothetical protein
VFLAPPWIFAQLDTKTQAVRDCDRTRKTPFVDGAAFQRSSRKASFATPLTTEAQDTEKEKMGKTEAVIFLPILPILPFLWLMALQSP